jgi:exodeoxyribonuclease VII large subunit
MALRLAQALHERANPLRLAVAEISARLDEVNLRAALAVRRTRVETLARRLETAVGSTIATRRMRLGGIGRELDAVSPLKVLERGYAVVVKHRDGTAVVDASAVEVGDELDIRLRRGRLSARTIGREV